LLGEFPGFNTKPGWVNAYNPSYLGDKDREDCDSSPTQAKRFPLNSIFKKDPISINKIGMVVHTCNTIYM
jgi:hypothetical protein